MFLRFIDNEPAEKKEELCALTESTRRQDELRIASVGLNVDLDRSVSVEPFPEVALLDLWWKARYVQHGARWGHRRSNDVIRRSFRVRTPSERHLLLVS